MNAADRIHTAGIVPVASVADSQYAVELCAALESATLPVVEITFRTTAAADAIAAAVKNFPNMLVGAGTVLTREDVHAAHNAGAHFAVAPGLNPTVVQAAHEVGLPFFPGVSTPSDIEAALQLNCTVLKLFPAEALGGPAYLKAIAAPYAHKNVRFIPTGGINPINLGHYLALPQVIAVGGTWIAPKNADRNAITRTAREAAEKVRFLRDPKVFA